MHLAAHFHQVIPVRVRLETHMPIHLLPCLGVVTGQVGLRQGLNSILPFLSETLFRTPMSNFTSLHEGEHLRGVIDLSILMKTCHSNGVIPGESVTVEYSWVIALP